MISGRFVLRVAPRCVTTDNSECVGSSSRTPSTKDHRRGQQRPGGQTPWTAPFEEIRSRAINHHVAYSTQDILSTCPVPRVQQMAMGTHKILTVADLTSLIGPLWATDRESRRLAASQAHGRHSLRLDLPAGFDHAKTYARNVAAHLGSDVKQTSSVFTIFTEVPWTPQGQEFLPRIIHDGSVRHANPCRLDRRALVLRHAPDPHHVLRSGSPAQVCLVELHRCGIRLPRAPGPG